MIAVLSRRQNPLAFLTSIAVVSVAGWALGDVRVPDRWLSAPDFTSVLFKLDVWGALQLSLLPSIVAITMTDLFDSISSFIGVSQATGLVDEHGQPLRLRQGLIVDSFATLGAGLLGTSSGTAYVESIAGIRMGGRTGLTAVVTALCFLPCLFIAPLAGGGAGVRHLGRAHRRRRVDVPGRDAGRLGAARGSAARLCGRGAHPADLLDHAGPAVGLRAPRRAPRGWSAGPATCGRCSGAWRVLPRHCSCWNTHGAEITSPGWACSRAYAASIHSGGGVIDGSGGPPGSGRPEPSSRLIARTVMS